MKHNLSQIDTKINKKSIFINKDNLSYNYKLIQRHVRKSKVISVIKGDGYGHGLLECCKILKSSNCNDFYVARLDDALRLRENNRNINIYNNFDNLSNSITEDELPDNSINDTKYSEINREEAESFFNI